MRHSIQFGSKEITFDLVYTNRKTLGITITPELQVLVSAPEGAQLAKIESIVRKRAPWIIRQENFFLQYHPKTPARKFVAGESHLYLGRQYILKVKVGKRNDVHRKRNTIEVTVKNKNLSKKVVNQWYRLRAKQQFAEIAEPIIEKFKNVQATAGGASVDDLTVSVHHIKSVDSGQWTVESVIGTSRRH